MATKYAQRIMMWDPSPSPDVVGYKIYYCLATDVLNFQSSFVDVGNVTQVSLPQDVPALAGMDDVFKVAIAAYDDGGNEEMGGEAQLPLDFIAPGAPGIPYLV